MNGGAIVIDLDLLTDAFDDGIASAERRMTTFSKNTQRQNSILTSSFNSLGKAIVAAFSVKAIINFTRSCIELGSEMQETSNLLSTVFKKNTQEMIEWSKTAITAFGMSSSQAQKYAASFGAMANSFGFSNREMVEMSQTLTKMVGDVSSLYNLSHDVSFTKLKSIFTGETEALKSDLSVVMTQTALDQFALEKGFGKTTKQMSEQEKVSLRLAFVMDKLGIATDDFIKNQNSWANQTNILMNQWNELKGNLGQMAINVLTPLIKNLNTLLTYLVKLTEAAKEFSAALFGHTENGLEDTTEDMTGIEDSANAAADAVDRMTASFDQLHKLSGNNDLSSDLLGGLEDSATGESESLTGEDGLMNRFKNEIDKFMNSNIVKAFQRFWESLKNLVITIGEKVKTALENVDWEEVFGHWADILEVITGWINTLADAIGDSDTEGLSKALTFLLKYLPELWAISTAFSAANTAVSLLASAPAWAEILVWIGLIIVAVESLKGILESTLGLIDTMGALQEEYEKDPEGTIAGVKKGVQDYFANTWIGQKLGWQEYASNGGHGKAAEKGYTGGNMPAITERTPYSISGTSGDIALATAMLKNATAAQNTYSGVPNITNEIYLGQEKFEDFMVKTLTKINYKTGGNR